MSPVLAALTHPMDCHPEAAESPAKRATPNEGSLHCQKEATKPDAPIYCATTQAPQRCKSPSMHTAAWILQAAEMGVNGLRGVCRATAKCSLPWACPPRLSAFLLTEPKCPT